ncbi:MAG: DUF4136 domain-containing protein [Bryobacteraceae bacterium]
MKLIALTGLLCLGTMAFAQDVQFDYDRSANFGAYKTYQWVDAKGAAANQLMDQNIKRAVDAQFALKGMQRVESGADVQITYQVAIDQEKQFDVWGTGPRGLRGPSSVTSSTVEIGKLAVSVFDPAKNQMVWRGSASKTLDIKKDPEKNYQNLQKAMAKLFKNYPPAPGK